MAISPRPGPPLALKSWHAHGVLWALLLALDHEQHQSGAGHQGSQHAAQEQQPPQGRVGKAAQVNRLHELVEDLGRRTWRHVNLTNALPCPGVEDEAAACRHGRHQAAGRAFPQHDQSAGGAWLVEADAADSSRPGLVGLRQQGPQRRIRGRLPQGDVATRGCDLVPGHIAAVQIRAKTLRIPLEERLGAPRNQRGHQQQQAAESDHQVKGERQHRQGVVGVQPGARAFARTKGEEVDEYPLMGNHAAHQRDQHDHRCQADDPASQAAGDAV